MFEFDERMKYDEPCHDFTMYDDSNCGIVTKYFNGCGDLDSDRIKLTFKTICHSSKELGYIAEQLLDFKEQFEAKRKEYIEKNSTIAIGAKIHTNDKNIGFIFVNNKKAHAFHEKILNYLKQSRCDVIQVGRMLEMCELDDSMTVNRGMYVKAVDAEDAEIFSNLIFFNYSRKEE